MKATLIYSSKVTVAVKGGRRISVVMDLFKLPPGQQGYPDGYKFSWIAFDPKKTSDRVLFDVHPPKGPHLHVDDDPDGVPYEWNGIRQAEEFFVKQIEERFGKIMEDDE